ncbi:hypothetical protein A7K93_09185 [Candidatus Methylacidiphilum fumarolicum]|uniref:Circularly permuted ATP-grasp type 2 domain-containing protein n=2 Tax=Candidatus Methylacidiphilum fumarolicum TaxID=591154 RepID=I0JZF7_METFB|nr:circularly permuted type 2 ATP-grasp protein [Candidatus Methylacidiphilum fumarolicum]MBW6415768.1 circularly permuted type 2 ATP-grasp protein [Candidatus Methylacidiphilum fumarolicum]TFE66840.1 hypothetical protein A7K73_09800 [Candidatus Methylacidiphilum fumarolicum]TFE72264.1 hypothetical protein A7K93_09185 [Candidatus Methylacidiphilum fumarolicum]TFE72497.1 hypothetical protein A7K72_08570 [Candidatus Methylacidiphilum fumarolicum]TFE77669.1 hypothetical protein A7D33_03700 [Candi
MGAPIPQISQANGEKEKRLEFVSQNYRKLLLDGPDESLDPRGEPKREYKALWELFLSRVGKDRLLSAQNAANERLRQLGVHFVLKIAKEKTEERIFPFDILPRLILKKEWDKIQRGLIQRTIALNLFIEDVYGKQRILKEKVLDQALVLSSLGYLPQMIGVKVPRGIYAAICGCDLLQDENGNFVVLEDNLRIPSGAAYMLCCRKVLKESCPFLFDLKKPLPIQSYPTVLLKTLLDLHPSEVSQEPVVAVLTPGPYNSAYFEHAFLANQMGIPLVEPKDLVVENATLYLHSKTHKKRISILYRRIEESFIDPVAFRPDSLIGVKGLFGSFIKGGLSLVNAPGCGIGDDKAIYPYVPKMIRYYLNEEPILRNIETYSCVDSKQQAFVVDNLERLVVKEVNQSGGFGMLIGPASSSKTREEFKKRILAHPRNYIAQPLIHFSKLPCMSGSGIEPRRVDLRPFVLMGKELRVVPGGLTRVSISWDSFIVNSSQGGGSKDTWIIEDEGW